MFKVALKGILAHKRRLLLTALAVIIGDRVPVGDLHLLRHDPEHLQQPLRRRLPQHRRLRPLVQRHRGRLRQQAAGPAPRLRHRRGQGGPGRLRRAGRRHGLRQHHRQGRQAARLRADGAAHVRRRSRSRATWPRGASSKAPARRAADQVAIDKGSADKGDFEVGDKVQIAGASRRARVHAVGHRPLRRRRLPRRRHVRAVRPADGAGVRRPSPASSTPCRSRGDGSVSDERAGQPHRVHPRQGVRDRGPHRRGDHQGEPVRHPEEPPVLHGLPERLRLHRPVRVAAS